MEIILIILFLILILITTSRAEIHIENLEVVKNKIKFLIKIKFYILKRILIFSKKIKKRDILKLIEFSEKKAQVIKEKEILKTIPIEIISIDFNLNYGLKNVFTNIYVNAILNTFIPIVLYNYSNQNAIINYNISSNFKETYLYIKLKGKIKIDSVKIIRKILKEKWKQKEDKD